MIIGWGRFYLSTILDNYSRYIIAWKLCTTMKTGSVTDTLDLALQASGCDQLIVVHKPRLLSDNGASYISSELADWSEDQQMYHVLGAPYHPQTQGKIERWHQALNNRILLETITCPAISGRKLMPSSTITTTGATTRACRTSRLPMSTSGVKPPALESTES